MKRTRKRCLFVFSEILEKQVRPVVLTMSRLNRTVEKGGVICE